MPGLYGLLTKDPTRLPGDLEKMGGCLRSGRVSQSERWQDERVGVGLGRENLGIFSPEPQPARSAAGTLTLFFDGELFDTAALRARLFPDPTAARTASDADLALAVYQAGGPESFSRLHGVFSLALWDSQHQRLVLASDRFGLRPLYIVRRPGCFAFAAEIKALLSLADVPRTLSDAGTADFFSFGYVMGEKTLFEEVRLLPPATILLAQSDRVQSWQYWNLEYGQEVPHQPETERVEEFIHLLTQAVERRTTGRVGVGLPLSGGLDSRLLLGVLVERLGVSLPAFTYGLPDSLDMRRAARLAQITGLDHTALPLPENYLSEYALAAVERTEGLISCLDSHGLRLNDLAGPVQQVMLGNGGDSFLMAFRGYRKKLLTARGDPAETLYQATLSPFDDATAQTLFTPDAYARLRGKALANLRHALSEVHSNSLDNVYDANRLREFNRRGLLQGLYTTNTHLEYSEPYYDYDLVDFVLALPVYLRWERRLPRLALARLAPALARIEGGPLERTWTAARVGEAVRGRLARALPAPVARRVLPRPARPVSFTDLNRLLANGSHDWVSSVLLSERALGRGVFRPEAVRKMLQDHLSGAHASARPIGALLTFELFQRRFVEEAL